MVFSTHKKTSGAWMKTNTWCWPAIPRRPLRGARGPPQQWCGGPSGGFKGWKKTAPVKNDETCASFPSVFYVFFFHFCSRFLLRTFQTRVDNIGQENRDRFSCTCFLIFFWDFPLWILGELALILSWCCHAETMHDASICIPFLRLPVVFARSPTAHVLVTALFAWVTFHPGVFWLHRA